MENRRESLDRSFKRYDETNRSKECAMTKTLTAIAAAATITVAAVAAPQPAQARALAAGIIGGLAAGAILGAATANGPYGYYGPGYYYGPRPVYYRGPDCYWTQRRFWDGWAWHVRRVRVCD
jgi:hypothetical protein